MGIYDQLSQLEKTPAQLKRPQHPKASSRSDSRTRRPLKDAVRQQRADVAFRSKRRDGKADVTTDVTTSQPKGIDVRVWRHALENTETRNSALRITTREREQVEDIVRDLARRDKVKTSMNELARLGLLVLARDYRQRGRWSIVYRVKKS